MYKIEKLITSSEELKIRETLSRIPGLDASDAAPLIDIIFDLLWKIQTGDLTITSKQNCRDISNLTRREIEEIAIRIAPRH